MESIYNKTIEELEEYFLNIIFSIPIYINEGKIISFKCSNMLSFDGKNAFKNGNPIQSYIKWNKIPNAEITINAITRLIFFIAYCQVDHSWLCTLSLN